MGLIQRHQICQKANVVDKPVKFFASGVTSSISGSVIKKGIDVPGLGYAKPGIFFYLATCIIPISWYREQN